MLNRRRRLRYQIKALFTPSVWFRTHRTHKPFDALLWDEMQSCDIEYVTDYTAQIGRFHVWIENANYGNGYLYPYNSISCSRATALLLEERVRALRVQFGGRGRPHG